MTTYVAPKPAYFHHLLLIVPFQVYKSQAICNNAPPCHHRCWLLYCELRASCRSSLLFSPVDLASMIRPQDSFLLHLILYTILFFLRPSFQPKHIINKLGLREGVGISGTCFYMASSFHGRVLTSLIRLVVSRCVSEPMQ